MGAEFLVPLAIAAATSAVGTGVQYVSQSAANSRANNVELQNIQDQQSIRNNATSDVNQQINQIAKNTPANIANTATAQYINELRANAAGSPTGGPTSSTSGGFQTMGQPTAAAPYVPGASSRYSADVAKGSANVQDFGDSTASEMGQIDAAVRQRQNEGLDLGTLQSNLGILGAQSYSDNFVNQLRAQNAGTSSPWLSALSTILGSAGSGISKNVSYSPSSGFSLGTGAS